MISLKAEWLNLGAIPVYEVDPNQSYVFLEEPGRTWAGPCRGRRRVIIPHVIDCSFTELEERLPALCETMARFDGGNGTVILPIRTVGLMPEDFSVFVIIGLAYVLNSAVGTPLGEADLAQTILRVLRRDRGCQASLDALAGQDLPAISGDIDEIKAKEYEAIKRSLDLLREFLNEDQKVELTASGRFHVRGLDGHLYLIKMGHGHNVFRIEQGVPTMEYCLVAQGRVPVYDLMLTQKLLLETDPEKFFDTANIWSLRGGERVCLTPWARQLHLDFEPPEEREQRRRLFDEALRGARRRIPDLLPDNLLEEPRG